MWGLLVAAVIGIFGSFGSIFGGEQSLEEMATFKDGVDGMYQYSYFDEGFQENATSATAKTPEKPVEDASVPENPSEVDLPLVDVSRRSTGSKTTDKAEDGDAVTVLTR